MNGHFRLFSLYFFCWIRSQCGKFFLCSSFIFPVPDFLHACQHLATIWRNSFSKALTRLYWSSSTKHSKRFWWLSFFRKVYVLGVTKSSVKMIKSQVNAVCAFSKSSTQTKNYRVIANVFNVLLARFSLFFSPFPPCALTHSWANASSSTSLSCFPNASSFG